MQNRQLESVIVNQRISENLAREVPRWRDIMQKAGRPAAEIEQQIEAMKLSFQLTILERFKKEYPKALRARIEKEPVEQDQPSNEGARSSPKLSP